MTSDMHNRKEDMRALIMEVTGRLVADKGPDAVSLSDIADELNITKPALYYYFRDKEELIRACFEKGGELASSVFLKKVEKTDSLEDFLKILFEDNVCVLRKHPEAAEFLLKMIASSNTGILRDITLNRVNSTDAAISRKLEEYNLTEVQKEDVFFIIRGILVYLFMKVKIFGIESVHGDLPSRLSRFIMRSISSAKLVFAGLVFTSVVAVLPPPVFAAPEVLTIDGAVNKALEHNISVRNAAQTKKVYDEQVKEARGTAYPQISASAASTNYITPYYYQAQGNKGTYDYDNSYSGSLNLKQVLWSGGQVSAAINVAKLYSQYGDELLKITEKSIINGVKNQYYAVLLAKDMVDIQQEKLNLAKQHLETLETKYKQGVSSDLDVLKQRVEVLNSEPALTQAQNNYRISLLQLKNILGMEPNEEIELQGSLNCQVDLSPDLQDLRNYALANRLELKNRNTMYEMRVQNITITKAGHQPKLYLDFTGSYSGSSKDGLPAHYKENAWNSYAGLSLNLPIFSGGSVQAQVEQAKKQAKIAENDIEDLQRSIQISVSQAWLTLKEASMRLESQKTSVEQARKAMNATEVRFKSGIVGLLDLNDSVLSLNTAQTLFSQAAYDTCVAKSNLEWNLGK